MNQNLYTQLKISPNHSKIKHSDFVAFIGSCFSENISSRLKTYKFNTISNPYGILFDPFSIERCINEIASNVEYTTSNLFYHNELFSSWHHHSDYSDTNASQCIQKINNSITKSRVFLEKADFIIITLGSSFSYYNTSEKDYVANCHKLPQTNFDKRLIDTCEILNSLIQIKKDLHSFNKKIKIILTISPVRHLRDGVIENNRSKARLIEAVHQFIELNKEVYYFPSYEIVIDVLRDYRFFDIDYAHPNYLATDIVFNYFKENCIHSDTYYNMDNFHQLYLAAKHRSRNPETNAHKQFLASNLTKVKEYQLKFPELDFSEELNYFEHSLF